MTPLRQIRARFDERSVVVYQAYRPAIAEAAVAAQRFVPPFSMNRMTWVKPSFLWMMERCGWATKVDQERVLAIHLSRERFEAALSRAVPTHFVPALDPSREAWERRLASSPVRVQWDPERTVRGEELEHRSLQLGIGPPLAAEYAASWVTRLEDVTPLVQELRRLRSDGAWARAEALLPVERAYPLPAAVAARMGASTEAEAG
jgi:hypothetical protein